MKFENFDITEKGNEISVFAQIARRQKTVGVPKIRIFTEDISLELSNRGVEHGRALKEVVIKNYREDTRRGTWVFEKKMTKPLDKSAEKVILPIEEEKPAPKKRKSRAKKKTTK